MLFEVSFGVTWSKRESEQKFFHASRENDITGVIDGTFATAEEGSGEMVTVDLKPGGASWREMWFIRS